MYGVHRPISESIGCRERFRSPCLVVVAQVRQSAALPPNPELARSAIYGVHNIAVEPRNRHLAAFRAVQPVEPAV